MARRAVRGGRLVARHLSLAVRRRLVTMPIDVLTDEFAFALSPGGWQPLVEVLRAYDDDPGAPLPDTAYGRFFLNDRVNRVRDLNELLDLTVHPAGLSDLPRFWLGTYPWGGLAADEVAGPGPAFGWAYDAATGADTADRWGRHRTLWYRPSAPETLDNERRLTVDLYRSIRCRYSPLRARGYPRVTVLQRGSGERRGVIVDGHHRLAVLAHLGHRRVRVEIERVINADDAASWYHVRSGHCSVDQARPIFDAFFTLDGSERFALVAGTEARTDGT